ncbi:MAG: ACT domain-containing protein [Planctomycetes bacterium]|nr:ACT domain-containing protein [Planctomycetota bacterium]
MTFAIQLQLKRAEGALVRVLGLVGRRGYEVIRVEARPSGDERVMDVVMTVQSDRPADVLVRHMAKLFDVVEIQEMREMSK